MTRTATTTGRTITGEFSGQELPEVAIDGPTRGLDCLVNGDIVEVVDADGPPTPYYFCGSSPEGAQLCQRYVGRDYGGNLIRSRTAPKSTAGIAAKAFTVPVTAIGEEPRYWVRD